ncbi:MAG: serine/threonine-protein kinase [Planctomycetota bacterium]|nr:serine/threonine-protein kinase [Planctomycetota bacterium]MDA1177918.1 serine/threonine-protein kinase [Planctomycetota bacterium]
MNAAGRNYIGPYRLLKLVRAGQTCQIWEVISDVNDVRRALKALQPDYRNDKDEIALLKHEYSVGKNLDHPSVIHVHEFNIDRGQIPYLVLDYFVSQNLKQWVRSRSEFDKEIVTGVVEKTAAGLDYLHEQGWVHRDVKPDNYLINDAGDVRLIDFAIARRPQTGLARLFSGKSKIQGTRSYMSPEQIRGQAVDHRADIYSYGCTIYEVICGKPPFTGESTDDLLQKHLRTPAPSLISGNPDVTPEFSEAVSLLMSKRKEDRPQRLKDFLEKIRTMRLFKGQQRRR